MAVRGTDPVYDNYTDEELANYDATKEYHVVRVYCPASATNPVEAWDHLVTALDNSGLTWEVEV